MRIFKANGRTGRTYYVFPRKKKPEQSLDDFVMVPQDVDGELPFA